LSPAPPTVAGSTSLVGVPRRSVGRRRLVDRTITVAAWAAAAFGVFIMGWIVVTVVLRGIGAINWAFFTQTPPPPGDPGGFFCGLNCTI